MLKAEKRHIIEFDRVGNSETELVKFKKRLASLTVSQARGSNDGSNAQRYISCKGFMTETAADRVTILERFPCEAFWNRCEILLCFL